MVAAFKKFTFVSLLCLACWSCSDSIGSPDDGSDQVAAPVVAIGWEDAAGLPSTLPAGRPLTMTVIVTRDGAPFEGAEVKAEILMGGGSLDSSTVVTEADGLAMFDWTVGNVPVRAAVRASVVDEPVFVDHVLQVESNNATDVAEFGDVGDALETAGVSASTEGLAFDDSGNLWLAAGGYLVRLDAVGEATLVEVDTDGDGDGLEAPLGMAWDYLRECLWIADTASIRKVTISTGEGGVLTADARKVPGLTGLITPNSVAIKDNRYVYFTDSCTGGLYRFDPEADPVVPETVAQFNLLEQGGPNGLAFDNSGTLWVTTENVALLCPDSGVDVTKNLGGLYKVDVGGVLPVTPDPRLTDFAMYGDGLAFDADGNLYVIFDHFDGFTLTGSGVWLVPETGDPVLVTAAPVADGAAGPDRLIANMAWGYDEFGAGTVYFSLLAVPLVTTERGAMKANFGIDGRYLLPADLPE